MSWNDSSYKEKKVISIGIVSELTGLSERQIRYYEDRKLVFPERSKSRIRKYSFQDIEILVDIANQLEDGIWTNEIRKELKRREQDLKNEKVCDLLINTEAR
ncbi:MerR family transcriptional regulator [Rummeliibacillus pycnus]|uniref:MerR family transcriptional regulator n=1 Tax=Rummeliibacillus pycnus TaxID=101070 RepID=UPI003D27229A